MCNVETWNEKKKMYYEFELWGSALGVNAHAMETLMKFHISQHTKWIDAWRIVEKKTIRSVDGIGGLCAWNRLVSSNK